MKTVSDHDGNMVDGDWERPTPGGSARAAVLGVERASHGGSGVTLQSTGYDEILDPDGLTNPNQPKQG